MRIKSTFSLRSIAGNWVALPLGEATIDFRGMLTLNESSVMLWRKLEGEASREELIEALLGEYEVSRDEATRDVDEFISKLSTAGCIEE